MKNANNICKFVPQRTAEQLVTVNFVYEKGNPEALVPQIKQNNAMCLVTSGKGTLTTALFSKELQPGTLFFTFAAEMNHIESTDNLQFMYITFSGLRAAGLFERFNITPSNCVFEGFEGLFSFWGSSLGKANKENLDLISESVLLYTFSQMSQTFENRQQHLSGEILSHIESCFTDSTLSLSSVAESLGYTPKYISRVFSKEVGITFSEYLKNTRIKHAVFLVEQGITSVKNIAILSGYRDPLYFSKIFQQTVGISPSEFINKKA